LNRYKIIAVRLLKVIRNKGKITTRLLLLAINI